MNRPRRSEHVREALIQAGMEQISHFGYHGTGIKQILDEVKVPKGSFYNFFASKEAFVAEVIQAYIADTQQQQQAFITGAGKDLSAKEQLRTIYEYSVSKIAATDFRSSCLIGSLSIEIGAESEECRAELKNASQQWIDFFTDLISQAQDAGDIRNDLSAAQLARIYWATWEGALIKLQMNKDIAPAIETMALMLDDLMRPNSAG